MKDLLTPIRAEHHCPDCSGSFKPSASHPADAGGGGPLRGTPLLAPPLSPWRHLRRLIYVRAP